MFYGQTIVWYSSVAARREEELIGFFARVRGKDMFFRHDEEEDDNNNNMRMAFKRPPILMRQLMQLLNEPAKAISTFRAQIYPAIMSPRPHHQ
jgi:hypothetical protein